MPENSYFRLSATAFDRTVWSAEKFMIDPHWPVHGEPIIEGKLWALSTEWQMPEPSYSLRREFLEAADIPFIIETYKFSEDGRDYEVHRGDNDFTIDVRSPQPFDPYFHARIQEALRFLLAQSVTWRILLWREGLKARLDLSAAAPRSTRTQLDPPVPRPPHSYLEDCWRLFSLYLAYVTKNTSHPHWHACSYHLHNACEASANSLGA